MRRLFIASILTTIAVTASAQHHGAGGHHPAAQAGTSPYTEFRTRSIKALSQQQVDDLLTGRGMGLALAAELNGYPGPMHVLEQGHALVLSSTQKNRMEALMADMRVAAVKAGEAAVAAETALDRLFVSGTASNETLRTAIDVVAKTHGEVRFIHLATHIRVRAELTPEQIANYDRLRGYVAK
jgi:hypothetical protein